MMASVASKVPFFQLCNILERIQKKSGNDNKKKLLKEFVDEWRSFHAKIHKDDKDTVSIVLQKTVPAWEKNFPYDLPLSLTFAKVV